MTDVFKELREQFEQMDRPIIARRTAALSQAAKMGLTFPRDGDDMATFQIETAVRLAAQAPNPRTFSEPSSK